MLFAAVYLAASMLAQDVGAKEAADFVKPQLEFPMFPEGRADPTCGGSDELAATAFCVVTSQRESELLAAKYIATFRQAGWEQLDFSYSQIGMILMQMPTSGGQCDYFSMRPLSKTQASPDANSETEIYLTIQQMGSSIPCSDNVRH